MIACPQCRTEYDEDGLRFCGRCGADMRPPDASAEGGAEVEDPSGSSRPDPLIGQVLDGRYRVISRLGRGGMGAVYRVEHLAMSKQAAMKVLHPVLTGEPDQLVRFRREAEAVSRLSSPYTVQVFDFGRTRQFVYLVMELVRGEDLGTILRRDGPMPWGRLRPLAMQICEALEEAHELGIVHRDLKPENLLVSRGRGGRELVKVVDFGLAKLRDAEELSRVTARGSVVGTPYYMSPEQARAEEGLDARSDLYSLGAVLYRALTGEHPFVGPTPMAVLTQHLTGTLVPPSERNPEVGIDARVDALVQKAMARDAAERFQSAEELRAALEALIVDEVAPPNHSQELRRRATDQGDTTPRDDGQLRREDLDAYERALRRRRWMGWAALGLAIAGAAGGAGFVYHRQTPRPVTEELEPNDTAATANLIAAETTVRGRIGKVAADKEPDRDYYRFVVDQAPTVLRVSLTGIAGMNLKLQVYDPDGQRVADADDGGPGEAEELPNVRLEKPGEHYVAVREVRDPAREPRADGDSEWYTLTAAWHALPAAGEESEPDDTPAQALPLEPGAPERGFAGRSGDVDYYYVRGEGGGTLEGSLSAIDGVDLRIVALPPGTQPKSGGALPPGARVFDSGGAGQAEVFAGVAWPAGSPSPLLLVERKEKDRGRDKDQEKDKERDRNGAPAAPERVSVTTPYTLVARLKPGH